MANAKALHRSGQRSAAEQGYVQVLALAPEDVEALNNLAIVRAEQAKHEPALEALVRLADDVRAQRSQTTMLAHGNGRGYRLQQA